MAINYNINNGEFHLSIDIDANTPRANVDRDIAIAVGAIFASGHGQVLFGTMNWQHISSAKWNITDRPKLVEKYGYCILPDESHDAYCAVMAAAAKVAKYPNSQDIPAESQPADNDVVTGEVLARFNRACAEVADKLSEFYNSGKNSVSTHEVEELGREIGDIFNSFNPNAAGNAPAATANSNIANMLGIDISELGLLADPDHEKLFLKKLAAATQPATKNAAAYAEIVKDIAMRCNIQGVSDEKALKFVLYHWDRIQAFN